jgi:DNA-binding transcriptional MerR regulator
MSLLTIGAFARASRLSPKALRLYDDLGLLRPVEVDPASGYRFYDPAQLDRARLDPGSAVDELIELANEEGGPDNIARAVADVVGI